MDWGSRSTGQSWSAIASVEMSIPRHVSIPLRGTRPEWIRSAASGRWRESDARSDPLVVRLRRLGAGPGARYRREVAAGTYDNVRAIMTSLPEVGTLLGRNCGNMAYVPPRNLLDGRDPFLARSSTSALVGALFRHRAHGAGAGRGSANRGAARSVAGARSDTVDRYLDRGTKRNDVWCAVWCGAERLIGIVRRRQDPVLADEEFAAIELATHAFERHPAAPQRRAGAPPGTSDRCR